MTLVLRDYQVKALDDLRRAWSVLRREGVQAPRLLLVSRTGCHARGQGILMHDGSIRAVEDVTVGDRLMGPDSAPRTVLGLSRGRGRMVRIVPRKGRPFVVNEDHVLTLVRTSDGKVAGGGLVDVTVKAWLGWSAKQKHLHKLVRTGVDFHDAEQRHRPIDPYFLGVLLGDGSIIRGVSVCKPDEEIRQVVRAQAVRYGLDVRVSGKGTSTSLFLTRGRTSGRANPVMEDLRRLGLYGLDGGAKFVPLAYLTASRADRLELLAGLMDTDGTLSSNGYDFISKSKRLAEDVAFLARSLGLAAYVVSCEKRAQTGNGGTYHRVSIYGDTHLIPCRLPRKQAAPRQQKKSVLRTGFSVEPLPEDDYYGFTLDGDGRFLLDDFTITHNTGKTVIAGEFLRAVVAKGRRALFVVRDRVLLDQTSGHLDRVGVTDHGVIAAGHKRQRPEAPVQICSAQTLTAREAHPEADVLVFDEAHGIMCDTSKSIADAYPEATILGLTATPVRGDGKPLGVPFGVFQRLIQVQATFAQLVELGALVDVDVIAPVGSARQHLAAKPIEALEQYGRGRRVVVFLRSIAQAEELAEQARARGFRAASVHGESEDREEVLERIGLPNDDPQALDVLTNCDLLKQGWDCLDERTEVLTPNGWKGPSEITAGDDVYAVDPHTGCACVVPAIDVGKRLVREGEKMVRLLSQRIDVRVTERHNVFVRKPSHAGHAASFEPIQAARLVGLASPVELPLAGEGTFHGVSLTDDELRLVAWFLTDGGFSGHSLVISQSKGFKDEIRDLLLRLRLDFTESVRKPSSSDNYKRNMPLHIFRIPKGSSPQLPRRGWVKYVDVLDKGVADALHAMTREQFMVFWRELLKGNGEQFQSKSGWLWCSQQQADALMHMAAVRGFGTSCNSRLLPSGVTMFRVTVRERRTLYLNFASGLSVKPRFEQPTHDESVWCVTNSLGTLITRRNGKVCVLGNCPAVDTIVLARGCSSFSQYMQICGRALRPIPPDKRHLFAKNKALIVDLRGAVHKHGHPADDVEFALEGKPVRSKEAEPKLSQCKSCGAVYRRKPACPMCGFEPEAKPIRTRVEAARMGNVKRRADMNEVERALADEAKQRAYFDELTALARVKNYKPGWVAFRYKARFGRWPPFARSA